MLRVGMRDCYDELNETRLCKSELTFHYALRARIWKPS